jgi:hypothetical protein
MASAERRGQIQAAVFGAELARRGANNRIGPLPSAVFPRLLPPTPDRLHSLVKPEASDANDPEVRLGRATVAALIATRKELREAGYVDSVLNKTEQQIFAEHSQNIVTQRNAKPGGPHICSYCDLSLKLQSGTDPQKWPAIHLHVANQGEISATFDPDSNVSSARLEGFVVLTRDLPTAQRMVNQAHPLNWAAASPTLFQRSDPAELRGADWYALPGDRMSALEAWNDPTATYYLYESVEWPWNEFVSYKTENIIEISDLKTKIQNGLSYSYSLKRALRSNFGVAWEIGGLDVDCGDYQAEFEAHNPTTTKMTHGISNDILVSVGGASLLKLRDAAKILRWPDYHVVRISASKSLRYTPPVEGPPELSSFLNWTSPALLFAFLDRAFCQSVYSIP